MPRLAQSIKKFLKEGESFTWSNRNMPVYPKCEKDGGDFLCISHKIFLNREKNKIGKILKHHSGIDLYKVNDYEEHTSLKQIHVIVWYCIIHERMEEV